MDPAEELALLVRTGWRLIILDTFEEERALRMLERVAAACERRLIVWSIASGLGDEGKGAGSLDEGLQAIESVSEPALIALLDPQRSAQGDIAARRQVREEAAVLHHEADALAQLPGVGRGDGHAIKGDGAGVGPDQERERDHAEYDE